MKTLSHERARQLLHALPGSLSVVQQADLSQHLASCAQCKEYASTWRSLQPALERAMHARWDLQTPPSISSRAIQERWKRVRRKRQSGRLLVALAVVSAIVLMVVYGSALLPPLVALLNIQLEVPPPTVAPLPADTTATPTLGSLPTEGAAELVSPPFALVLIAGSFSSPERSLISISSDGGWTTGFPALQQVSQPSHPVWSPDGRKIAFLDCQEVAETDKNNSLYVINRDGSGLTSMELALSQIGVAPTCTDDSISWSPDSTRIAFEGRSLNSPYDADIYVASAGGEQVENLTENLSSAQVVPGGTSDYPERASEHFPTWSPDGSVLAMVVNGEIYIVGAGGEDLRKFTAQQGSANSLNWTPDGRSIVYENGGIQIVSIEDGVSRSVLDTGEQAEIDPDLSPDGSQVVYYSGYGGLYVVDIDGKNLKQIVATEAFGPSWSPDGKYIAYKHPINPDLSSWYLSVISKDGSEGMQLVEIALGNVEFSWSYFTQGIGSAPGLTGAAESAASPTEIPAVVKSPTPTAGFASDALPEAVFAFIYSEHDEPAGPVMKSALGMLQGNGEGLRNLTQPHKINYPSHFAWSPDGSQIAFVDCKWSTMIEPSTLYVISRDGSNLISMEELMNAAGFGADCSTLSWSPDGQWIAVKAIPTEDQHSDILLVSAQGDSVRNLTAGLVYEDISACQGADSSWIDQCLQEMSYEQNPIWAPDGSALAVLIDNEIYLISIDGKSYRRLTDQPGWPAYIEWTPDSQYLVYSNPDYDGLIYAVSVDTGEIRPIIEGNEPDLSPDGTRIVFTRLETGIYTVDISGENLDHIVAGHDYYSPRWTPDSQFISYSKFGDGKQTISIAPWDGGWEKVIAELGLLWNNEFAWSK